MDEKFNRFKQVVVSIFKNISRPIFIKIGIICIIIMTVAGMIYHITIDDGSYKEGDSSNTPYAVEQYTSDVIINSDGQIETSMTAEELWNKMLEENSRVNEYLDGPEELQKLMNAQIITDYLDTRENPDDPIDWEELNKDVESKKVQGIIKLKRAQDDGNTKTLIYTDPETFQTYIDNYNETGAEADKQKALSYFTLEKGYATSSFGAGASITAGTTIMIPAGLGSVHTYMGWQMITDTTSNQYKLREQAGMNFDEEGFGRINGRYVIACTTTFGNVGDYIDFYQEDGSVIQCIIGDIKNQNDAGCNEWGHLNGTCIIEFVVDKDSWYNSNHPNPGQQGFHMEWNQNLTKAINGGSYFDNPNFGSENITGNSGSTGNGNTMNGELMKWPTDGTTITSYFGYRNAPTAGASTNHRGIDIGIPTGTNIYATEAGTVTTAGWSDSAGNWVIIDHGNGYVTKYMHNSALKVAVGEKVEKGQVIALAGSTGISTGPHLHFQIEFNGVAVDPLTFKYDNGMGDGVGGIGSNAGSLSTNSTFYAKVATWSEVTDIVESDDPEVEDYTTTRYNMTSTKINYQQFVSEYKMPFDYLWALLVVSQEKDFVFELADLVYDSEIEITVHDNLSINTNVSTDTYTNKTKVVTDDVKVKVEYTDKTISYDNWDTEHQFPYETTTKGSATESGGPFEKESEKTYTTTQTVITKTNTLDISLTKADVWIVNYTQEYTYKASDPVVTPSEIKYDDEEYSETPDKADNIDSAGLAEKFRQEVHTTYSENYTNVNTQVTSLNSEYYYKTVNRTVNINNTLETTKYISSPANIIEKTDKQSNEPNFITILLDNNKAENNIRSAADWLFKILETGPNTVDMLDLTKYLLYKATNKNYGVTEFDFGAFDPKNFVVVGGMYGNTVEEKVWFALREAGYSEYAVAGVMGNIYCESGFDPAIIEKANGIGFGLCQWSYGRRTQLESYAASKGVEPSDVETQIEFLITEITPGAVGPAQGFANYQLLSYKGYNGDMWRNATTPESAAVAFCWSFERPGSPNVSLRQQKAREYYEQFKGKTRPVGASSILAACEEVTQEFLNRNGRYSLTNLIWGDIERCWEESQCICCASYVSLVLYRAGVLTPEQINAYNYQYTGSGGVGDMLAAAGWHQVSPAEAQPGDVVNDYECHALIYAGNGQCWDQTSCVISSKGYPPSRTTVSYDLTGCQIWRAP